MAFQAPTRPELAEAPTLPQITESSKTFGESLYTPQLMQDTLAQSAWNRAQQAALNLETIQNARAKREDDRARLDLEKKKAQVMLDEAEMNGQMSKAQRAYIEALTKEREKQAKTVMDSHDVVSEEAAAKHKAELQDSIGMLTSMLQGQPQTMDFGVPSTAAAPNMDSRAGVFNQGRPLAMMPQGALNQPAPVGPSIPMQGGVQEFEEPPVVPKNIFQRPDKGMIDFVENPRAKDNTSMEALKLRREERLTSQQENANALRLRGEFNNSQIKKDFDVMNRAFKSIEHAYETSTDPKSPSLIASDQALGIMIQKMLDPASVVRESEYARTPQGAAVMSQIQAFIPKLAKGGMAITDKERKAILDMARQLMDATGEVYNSHINRYKESAAEFGVDPDKVLKGIKEYTPSSASTASKEHQVFIEKARAAGYSESEIQEYLRNRK